MAKECDQESLRGSRKPQEGASGPQSGGESGKQVPKCKKIDPRGIEKNIRKKTETLNIDDPLKEYLRLNWEPTRFADEVCSKNLNKVQGREVKVVQNRKMVLPGVGR